MNDTIVQDGNIRDEQNKTNKKTTEQPVYILYIYGEI